MFDIINRTILSPSSLRVKRREDQISRLQKIHQQSVSANVAALSKTRQEMDEKDIHSFIDDFLKETTKSRKHKQPKDDSPANTTSTVANATTSTPSILGLTSQHVFLSIDKEVVQAPLLTFVNVLAKAFEEKMTSTALCFVADASSALGLDMIHQIVKDSDAGMALVQQPAWMANLALLHSKFDPSNLQQIIFAFSRLDAWRVRDQVGEARTAVFTLPGQGTTSILLPILQKVFPCERHVFVYDGGIDSVSRGVTLTCSERERTCHFIPFSPIDPMPCIDELAKLAITKAELVEAWMSSIDAFLKLKHAEKKTGYVPFVCRLGFLMSQVGQLGNGKVDQSELALKNLLQYMTGSKSSSRALKESVLENAKGAMLQVRSKEMQGAKRRKGNLSEYERGMVEECAFAHKGILIENKTLMDTVQPKAEWSLKAAKKMTSCACCMPGQGDEESDEEEDKSESETEGVGAGKGIAAITGVEIKDQNDAKAMFTATPSTNYVDGKSMFAFDPSKFTGM
mmetsp:Transcript_178/g.285  ORF Transcript_178/g.285 Transcript_178/m.285 type:complete len:512 (-) Transcript_178:97-1632(-)